MTISMKVSNLRQMLKGIKGTEDIIISVPTGKGYNLYPQFSVELDKKLKIVKLKVNENY